MPLTDTLHLVAELAVAFAGFASLVSIIGRRRSGDSPKVDAARIRGMLRASLLCAAFAFVPILVHEAGLSAAVSWRVSAGLFAGAAAFLMVFQVRDVNALARYDDYHLPGHWRATVLALWVVTLSALLLTTIGGMRNGGFGYSLGLFAMLVYAGSLFIRLVGSLLEGQRAGE